MCLVTSEPAESVQRKGHSETEIMSTLNVVDSTAVVSMPSTWNVQKQRSTTVSQTMSIATVETDAQTDISALAVSELLEKGEGTDRTVVPQAKMTDTGTWIYSGVTVDNNDLAAFMKESVDELRPALIANAKSTAFDNYEPSWKPRRQDVSLIATVSPPAVVADRQVTAIAFNSNATYVAVSYARVDIASWCQAKGHVAVFNVAQLFSMTSTASSTAKASPGDAAAAVTPAEGVRTVTDAGVAPGTPFNVLEADSYVTSIAFHPANPTVLAGGSYNGEIILWNLAEERAKPVSSTGCSKSPREPILQLKWLLNPREMREQHRFVLCSASADGKIQFWTPSNKLADPLSGYEVQNRKRVVLGVQSMSFVASGFGPKSVPGVQNVMLLGLESGDVFRTKPGNTIGGAVATAGTGAAAPSTSSSGVLEVDHFEPHRGPVHGIDCSPFFRNLFLTASSDGAIRLFSTLERAALLALEPFSDSRSYLYGAAFSPARPAVIAAISRSSHLVIYDMLESKAKPVLTVEAGVDGAAALAMAWSRALPDLLATGDAKGNVRLWQLSSQLCEPVDLERAAMAAVTAGGAAVPSPASGAASPVTQALPAAASAAAGAPHMAPMKAIFGVCC